MNSSSKVLQVQFKYSQPETNKKNIRNGGISLNHRHKITKNYTRLQIITTNPRTTFTPNSVIFLFIVYLKAQLEEKKNNFNPNHKH